MPSGMTAIAQPRSRTGVSLPMGVKISPLQKDQAPVAWRDTDDLALQQSVKRFGTNWLLVAKHIQGFQEFGFLPMQGSDIASLRSCRDRWHALTRKDPELSNQIRLHEKRRRAALQQSSHLYESRIEGGQRLQGSFFGYGDDSDSVHHLQTEFDETPRVHLLPPIEETSEKLRTSEKVTAESPTQTNAGSTSRKSFAAFDRAKNKVQKMPLLIPGVSAGSPPSIAPSHSSHMQAVQAALAASNSSSRNDVWPLQLLAANRKRDAAAATATASTGGVRSSAPTTGAPRSYPSTSSSRTASGNNRSQGSSRPRTGNSPARSTRPTNARSSSSSSAAAAQSFVPPPNQLPPAPSTAIAGHGQTKKPGT